MIDPPVIAFRLQPIPLRVLISDLDGITALTRLWADGDRTRCTLCDECTAIDIGGRSVCTIQTDEAVTDGGAALYSRCGSADAGGRETSRAPVVLAVP